MEERKKERKKDDLNVEDGPKERVLGREKEKRRDVIYTINVGIEVSLI